MSRCSSCDFPFTHHRITLAVFATASRVLPNGHAALVLPRADLDRSPLPSPHRRALDQLLPRQKLCRTFSLPPNFHVPMTPPLATLPDAHGHFGPYGGMFVPETLMTALNDLTAEYERAKADPAFQAELDDLLRDFAGRPTPLYFAERLTKQLGGAKIYLKREDLLHTGAHKINNALGQILLARRMGKKRIIAETGAGQHGVATATVAARFGCECVIYMGAVDMERQALNVARMRFLGAKVVAVTAGQATLKEAINEAMRDWVTNVRTTHYILGSALGSHPYPMMVRDFHRVIGLEARRQILEREGRLPDVLVACVGGGSNAIGLFHPFLDDRIGENDRRRSWRRRHSHRQTRGAFSGRPARCAARHENFAARQRRRADRADPFRFRRA